MLFGIAINHVGLFQAQDQRINALTQQEERENFGSLENEVNLISITVNVQEHCIHISI